jgi:hypothetical protein
MSALRTFAQGFAAQGIALLRWLGVGDDDDRVSSKGRAFAHRPPAARIGHPRRA